MTSSVYLLILDDDNYVERCAEIVPSKNIAMDKAVIVNKALYMEVQAGLDNGVCYQYLHGDLVVLDTDLSVLRKAALQEVSCAVIESLNSYSFSAHGSPINLAASDFQYLLLAVTLNTHFVTSCGIELDATQANILAKDFLQARNYVMRQCATYTKLIKNAKHKKDIEKHINNFKKSIGDLV